MVKYYFKNECEGFIRFPNTTTFETTRAQAECCYCFRVFGNLKKPEARGFEITSPTKKNRSSCHFNEFSGFNCSFCGS